LIGKARKGKLLVPPLFLCFWWLGKDVEPTSDSFSCRKHISSSLVMHRGKVKTGLPQSFLVNRPVMENRTLFPFYSSLPNNCFFCKIAKWSVKEALVVTDHILRKNIGQSSVAELPKSHQNLIEHSNFYLAAQNIERLANYNA
jgi:hypothetical protein